MTNTNPILMLWSARAASAVHRPSLSPFDRRLITAPHISSPRSSNASPMRHSSYIHNTQRQLQAVYHWSLPVCIQCRLQTTPSLCQPRSSRRASLSSQQLQLAGFFCGRPCDMELVTRQYERPGHQQSLLQTFTENVFIFSLLVYIAH